MTEITVGAPVRPNYFDAQGNPGKPFRVEDLDGAIVKSAVPAGQALGLLVQLADGTEHTVTFNPSTAAGSGTPTFIASPTAYDPANNRITFTVGSPPVSFSLGDGLVFVAPANIDDATDNLVARDNVQPLLDVPLLDVDFSPVRAIDLLPNRLYHVRRLLLHGQNQQWVFTSPLHLFQLAPVQTVTRTLTNAELKAINLTAHELIPAPGAGKTIDVVSVKKSYAGSDRPTIVDDEPDFTPDTRSISDWGWLHYGFLESGYPDGTNPVPGSLSGDPLHNQGVYRSVDRAHFTGGLYAQDQSFLESIGRQSLQENRALSVFYVFSISGSAFPLWYSNAKFNEMMATANDNTVTIEVSYYIRDF